MSHLGPLSTLLVVLLWFSPAYAEGLDYFTADQVDATKLYLYNVTVAHTNKIPGYIRDGMMDAAIRDVKYTLDRFPNHPKGLMLLGVVARLTNDPSFAVNYYKRALSLFPQYAITHVQYGEYLVSVGLTNEGIGQLKRAIEIDPKLAVAYAGLAKAYAKGGNSELSRQAAKQARELGYTGKIGGQSSER